MPKIQNIPPPEFDENDVVRWFGPREVAKARPYLRQVSGLKLDNNVLFASVRGSAPQAYSVIVHFQLDARGRAAPKTFCSCPVGLNCKHGAAALLAWLESQRMPTRVNPEVLAWIEGFRQSAVQRPAMAGGKSAVKRDSLFYLLVIAPDGPTLRFLKGRADDAGGLLRAQAWSQVERALTSAPSFMTEADQLILPLIWSMRDRSAWIERFLLFGAKGEAALARMLATGRLYLDANPPLLLKPGGARHAKLAWIESGQRTRVRLAATPRADAVWVLESAWYVDTDSGEIGALETPLSSAQLAHLLALPPLAAPDVPLVAGALAELAPELPRPSSAVLRRVECAPRPVLYLATLAIRELHAHREYKTNWWRTLFDCARLEFAYEEFRFGVDDGSEFVLGDDGKPAQVKRDPARESDCIAQLGACGLKRVPARALPLDEPVFGLANEAAWPEFMRLAVPKLRENGWTVEIPKDFRHLLIEADAWEADFEDAGNGWLKLDLGVVIEGRRLPLAPLLHELFQRDPRWLDRNKLKAVRNSEMVALHAGDGTRIHAPASRIKPLATTLIDLFDTPPGGVFRISKLDAPRLAALAGDAAWNRSGQDAILAFARLLKDADGVRPVDPPAGFRLELRPYQREGLAWLQYLAGHDLAGILADDMGLGKTAQTLAHLLCEKQAGRLDRPALVVLPTSLVFNWKREAERFAPDLRVLSLHGKDRASRFAEIAGHDVVLTTYPLLWRDHETLAAVKWHLLILDEAQTVKNAGSRAAKIVRELPARHRLCLTGTPLENHLGELWAQFDFLLPGFLGDAKTFNKAFRNPIEKRGDALRADLLARRIAPFVLRRRKEDVAKELPEKTVIVRTVELVGGQRDLYETVRIAMDKRVLDAIRAQGFAKSQIVILDALLKLRQVCCDPRLVKNAGARAVKERAKLDLLMDMLPELVEEGRRVLLFSQFTSMLALIEAELAEKGIGYSLLTGDTRDRETPIRRFQDGEVPVFLISLKAGGVGLNLTAADTVIHYDPWWNPAMENQATDRAHRIGQTKRVFVYKLVVAGSIEEKILALQEKKAELAASVLAEDGAALAKFGEDDVRALLEPLPSTARAAG
ncbi:MAG: DEAD/DEAH box helicase [Thiobacillus sp.]|nr:DEAD/DEAH box helicase [Thiobacillus sp.]